MAPTLVRYEAHGWGVGELWLDGQRPVWHDLPAAKRPVRVSGPVEGVWGNREVSPATRRPPVRVSGPVEGVWGDSLAVRLGAYFAGEAVSFDDVDLDLDGESGFYREVARVLRGIPRGEVVTYGELAALAGRPGAARAAGTFCARNRLPIFIPCHRVVAAAGLGSYGSLGVDYKRRLLALESGRVPL